MSGFVWTSGHLGWGLFALLVFSGLWLQISDLVWRQTKIRMARFLSIMSIGWTLAAILIVLGFYAVNH